MVTYKPKDWFTLIFQFHRSDTFRVLLPTMVVLGIVTGGLVYLELNHVLHVTPSTVFHQIVGFVLSMLLVFRINTANERWWEGRKLWGTLVNSSRSLAAKATAVIPAGRLAERVRFVEMLAAFPELLRDHLRQSRPESISAPLPADIRESILAAPHRPIALFAEIVRLLEDLGRGKYVSEEQLLRMNTEVTSLIDVAGACERIKASPIPFSYSLFLKKIIFVYTVTMPFPFSAEFGYWAIPAVMILFYAFASIELVSEEVEEPFGFDSNDLPIDSLAVKIRNDLQRFLS